MTTRVIFSLLVFFAGMTFTAEGFAESVVVLQKLGIRPQTLTVTDAGDELSFRLCGENGDSRDCRFLGYKETYSKAVFADRASRLDAEIYRYQEDVLKRHNSIALKTGTVVGVGLFVVSLGHPGAIVVGAGVGGGVRVVLSGLHYPTKDAAAQRKRVRLAEVIELSKSKENSAIRVFTGFDQMVSDLEEFLAGL